MDVTYFASGYGLFFSWTTHLRALMVYVGFVFGDVSFLDGFSSVIVIVDILLCGVLSGTEWVP